MKNLKKYELDTALVYKYFCFCLENANELSLQLIKLVDFKSGTFFTILEENIDVKNLNQFRWGGISKGVVGQLQTLIIRKIKENDQLSCFFDNVSSSYDKEREGSLFLDVGLHYKDEVYYLVPKEMASTERLEECFYAADAIWHCLYVLSDIKLDVQDNKELSLEQIKNICLNTQLIILKAYDGESYVFWKKNSICDEKTNYK